MSAKKVTMTDVAEKAGVSQATVSQILSNKETSSFTSETIARVLDTAKSLGYRSKENFRPAAGSPYIMVFSVNISNPYYGSMLQSIEAEALAHKYRIMNCNTYRNASLETDYLSLALKMNVAGIIFLSSPHAAERVSEVAQRIPVVCICDKEAGLPTDIIEMNHAASAKLLVDHLVSLGHRKIALITSPLGDNKGRLARMDGLRIQMEKLGLSDNFVVRMVEESKDEEIGDYYRDYHRGYNLLQEEALYHSGITAFVCTNDLMALGVMDAILERGYKIPEDFSVCGFDNILVSQLHNISLTTVDHRMSVKGKSAMELLMRKIDLIKHQDTHQETLSDQFKIEYQPRLVVRNSTGPAPTVRQKSKK